MESGAGGLAWLGPAGRVDRTSCPEAVGPGSSPDGDTPFLRQDFQKMCSQTCATASRDSRGCSNPRDDKPVAVEREWASKETGSVLTINRYYHTILALTGR